MFLGKRAGNNGRTVMFGCLYLCERTAAYDFCGERRLVADNSLQKNSKNSQSCRLGFRGCRPEKSIRSTFRLMLPLFGRLGGKPDAAVVPIGTDAHIRNPG